VLADHDGHWLITHDTAMPALDNSHAADVAAGQFG
jgi:hypothetical protein